MNVSTVTNGDIASVLTWYDNGDLSLEIRKESDANDTNNTDQKK